VQSELNFTTANILLDGILVLLFLKVLHFCLLLEMVVDYYEAFIDRDL